VEEQAILELIACFQTDFHKNQPAPGRNRTAKKISAGLIIVS
jgi:hypothetical protein